LTLIQTGASCAFDLGNTPVKKRLWGTPHATAALKMPYAAIYYVSDRKAGRLPTPSPCVAMLSAAFDF
jgi:hypothetical protein